MTDQNSNNVLPLRSLLFRYWGYEHFRFPQAEVIQSLLAQRDGVAVMPTGGGKSLCFQLPAILQGGLTIVVSPLIALMENQVQELRGRSLMAACLHSELPRQQKSEILRALEQQKLNLLYVAPETLLTSSVWQILEKPQLKISGLMIDEAHCLVQWGDSFRPVYRRLGSIRPSLLKLNKPNFAIAAFTATADVNTQAEIAKILELNNPDYFILSPYRPHLRLTVKIAWSAYCRRHLLQTFITKHHGQSGLIYVRSRRDSEELSQWLRSENYATAPYHAGLGSQARREIEHQWLSGELPFVICTNAFGLGINKPDLRWILHYHPPNLLAEYLQEIGRAGRDQLPADCLTLVSEPTGFLDSTDKQRQAYFQQQIINQYRKAQGIVKQLPTLGNIQDLKKAFPDLELSLALLHRLGQLEWLDPFHYRLLSVTETKPFMPQSNNIQSYLRSRQCRWQFLLEAFGHGSEIDGNGCGECDNCRKRNIHK